METDNFEDIIYYRIIQKLEKLFEKFGESSKKVVKNIENVVNKLEKASDKIEYDITDNLSQLISDELGSAIGAIHIKNDNYLKLIVFHDEERKVIFDLEDYILKNILCSGEDQTHVKENLKLYIKIFENSIALIKEKLNEMNNG
jgi:hypothetical protein